MRERNLILEKILTIYIHFVICVMLVTALFLVTSINIVEVGVTTVLLLAFLLLLVLEMIWYVYLLEEAPDET